MRSKLKPVFVLIVILLAGMMISGVSLAAASDPLINEFVANHTGADSEAFVEVFGDPNSRKAAEYGYEKETAWIFKGGELSELTKEEESEIELKELESRLQSQTEELEIRLKDEIEMHVAMQQALL